MSKSSSGLPKRYGWNTPVTAPGPGELSFIKRARSVMADPISYLEEVWHAHGDIVQFPIPKPATYLVSSPQGARDVLVNLNRNMGKRTIQYTSLSFVTGEGLLTAETEAWRPRRRMLQPAFHREMIALISNHVASALANLDARWTEKLDDGVALIDVDQAMMSLALEITGKALFGVDLSGEADELTSATIDALHGVMSRAQNPLSLPLKIPTRSNVRLNRAVRRLDRAVAAIVDRRRTNMLSPDEPIRDMLDVLLDPDVEVPLTARQIRDEIVTFIVAGHETVASALTWSLHLLSENPEELHKLQTDPGRARMVFDETLRLYPPAWVITRRTHEDVTIDDIEIPANSLVIVSPWLVQRHESLWDSPNDFRPDRFANGVPQMGYVPFGAGPRICIGRDMALLEATQVLSHISQKWNIAPVLNQQLVLEASVTLRPAHGLFMRISPRD